MLWMPDDLLKENSVKVHRRSPRVGITAGQSGTFTEMTKPVRENE